MKKFIIPASIALLAVTSAFALEQGRTQRQVPSPTKTQGSQAVMQMDPPLITTGDAATDAKIKVLHQEMETKIKAIRDEYQSKIKVVIGDKKVITGKPPRNGSSTPKFDHEREGGDHGMGTGTPRDPNGIRDEREGRRDNKWGQGSSSVPRILNDGKPSRREGREEGEGSSSASRGESSIPRGPQVRGVSIGEHSGQENEQRASQSQGIFSGFLGRFFGR